MILKIKGYIGYYVIVRLLSGIWDIEFYISLFYFFFGLWMKRFIIYYYWFDLIFYFREMFFVYNM